MRRVSAWAASLFVVATALTGPGGTPRPDAIVAAGTTGVARPATSAAYPAPGPFFTFLFSRTEMTAAISCVPNSTNIARLDTDVAPYLASKGFTASGTLQTGTIQASSWVCTHSRSSMMGSWADATNLARRYAWTFVSHTATYPTANMETLTPQRQYAETCGSADAIQDHGLPGGHGFIAYPGAYPPPAGVQATYGSQCFAWGRKYNYRATTDITAGTRAPYWQVTAAPGGGPCNLPSAACYTSPAVGSTRYVLPSQSLANLAALGPGKWMTMQSFILVKGTNPPGSTQRWNCNAADPRLHWTSDNERYCWRDWKTVVDAVAARTDVRVVDPLTVGIAFGRPASYPDGD
jgi:hypothetical protein